jgi:hypothetical protein
MADETVARAGDDPVATTPSTGRTGVVIGILIVALLALGFYFYWRGTGARDETGRRPGPPPSATP